MSFSLINSSFTEAKFGLELLADLTENSLSPLVFSPVSILFSLALIHLGAKGHTRNDIRNAIANGSTDEQLIEHFSFLNKLLNSSVNDVEVLIANRLFVAPEQAIRKDFTDQLKAHYNSETRQIDFKSQENAAKIINEFISESTKGKIVDMIKPNTLKDVDSILINAIFFQGDWRSKFSEPSQSNFSTSSENSRLVPMLRELRDYHYNKDDDWHVVGIPFKDKSAWFAIFVPRTQFGLAEALKKLNVAKFHNLINNVYQQSIFFTFPKFKFDFKIDLKTSMKNLGLSELFTEQADLSGIGPGLQLASATHQAAIEVDQIGTRAAAVTESKIFFVSGSTEQPLNIRANHPFFFSIIKEQSPIFMGIYT